MQNIKNAKKSLKSPLLCNVAYGFQCLFCLSVCQLSILLLKNLALKKHSLETTDNYFGLTVNAIINQGFL